MTAPVLELIRAFPQSEIHLAVPSGYESLFQNFLGIRRIWPIASPRNCVAQWFSKTSIAYALRKENYHCVINFHASTTSSCLARATGAKCRSIHFHGHHDADRFSTVTIPGKGMVKPIIERDMDAVRALGVHIPAGRLPQIFLQPSELTQSQDWTNQLGLPTPLLGLGLGSSRPTKSWPIERYASLAVDWCRQEKGGAIAVAGSNEEELIHHFLHAVDDHLRISVPNTTERARIRRSIAATHQLHLRQLAALLSHCAVFAGNDSGPRHIAVAVNTPTVTLFGPEHPYEWHPYPKERHPHFFIDSLSCRTEGVPGAGGAWCGLSQCSAFGHRCMQLIGIDSVLMECRKFAFI